MEDHEHHQRQPSAPRSPSPVHSPQQQAQQPHQDGAPSRLSALYQFHNAPEVAPAHGLEYDDTIYPSSDKYPVIREQPSYDRSGEYGYNNDNRPPRIIFGMKVRTFLVVASVMSLIIVGAAVGGAVGGQQLRESQNELMLGASANSSSTTPTSSSAPTATASSYSAPTPTFSPVSDCPASNNTLYVSELSNSTSSSSNASTPTVGMNFTRWCDLSDPLTRTDATRLVEAYVYSFADCIEVCAGYNLYTNGTTCTSAVYRSNGTRPANCFVGNAGNTTVADLGTDSGTDVALLDD